MGCSKGFEIVDLESLDTQSLLDPADSSLDFVRKRENLRPMAIYRIDNEFLLCYDGKSKSYEWHYGHLLRWSKNSLSMSTGVVGDLGQTSWFIGKGRRQVSVSTDGDMRHSSS